MTIIIQEITPTSNINGLKETLANLKEIGDISTEEIQKLIKKMNDQDTHIFAAIENQTIIGTVALQIEQKLIHKGGKVGHIEDVATRKGYEGKGIASQLMKKAISYAKERECYKVLLFCKDTLIPFYNKFGFKEDEIFMRLNM